MNPAAQQIARKLEEGIGLAERLLQALADERTALESGNPEPLREAAARKESLFPSLQRLESELRGMLPHQGSQAEALQRLDESGQLATRHKRLRTLLERCAHQNRINGGIVELSQRHIRQSLAILRGNLGATEGTYDPRGRLHTDSTGHLLSKA